MKTIFIYIRDPKLKLSVIRILLENNLHFVEASSDMVEILIKLDLVKDIGLIIEEFQEGEKRTSLRKALKKLVKANKVPALWIIPNHKKILLSLAAKWQAADLMPLPLDELTFLRKINTILGRAEEHNPEEKMTALSPFILSYHCDVLKEALESADKGKYTLCIIRLQVTGLLEEESVQLTDKLKRILRRSDTILEVMDLQEYTILCPCTPKKALPVIESRIKHAAEEFILERKPNIKVHISGISFPDDVRRFYGLSNKLSDV